MLIVDDADMERSGIRFLVQKYEMPLQLYEACDGEEALCILGRTHIDILFTDIKMPRMDGIQLATNARMLYPELYIIFCSAYGEFEYAQKAVSLRASCYLLRPVRVEEFVKTLTDVAAQCEREQALISSVAKLWEKKVISEPQSRDVLMELIASSRLRGKARRGGDGLVDGVRAIVEERFAQDLCVDDIAQSLHLSAGHLCRSFKKETGVSLMQFVTFYRLERAKDLLLQTDFKIEEIAHMTGFQSASYFGMVFKRELNTTPGAFRERGKQG